MTGAPVVTTVQQTVAIVPAASPASSVPVTSPASRITVASPGESERSVRALTAASPAAGRVTLHHRKEADGFDYWVTGWSAADSTAMCIADPFARLCNDSADLPADRVTVYSEGGSFYPRLILVAPNTVTSVVAAFADGSSSSAVFKRIGTLNVSFAVVRYPTSLARSDVRLLPSTGPVVVWRLPEPPVDAQAVAPQTSAQAGDVALAPSAGPSVPPGMLRPSAAASVEGTG